MRAVLLAAVVAAGCSSDPASSSGRAYTWRFVDPDSGATVACPALVDRVEVIAEYPAITAGECAGSQPQIAADALAPCSDGSVSFDVAPYRPGAGCQNGQELAVLARALTADGAIYSDDAQRDQPTPMHADLEASHGLIRIMWNIVNVDGTTPATCKPGWIVRTSLGGATPCMTEGVGYAIGQRAGMYDLDVFVGLPPPYPTYGVSHVAGVTVTPDTITTVPVTIRLTQ